MDFDFYYACVEGMLANVAENIEKRGVERTKEEYGTIEDNVIRLFMLELVDKLVERRENWLAPTYERRELKIR